MQKGTIKEMGNLEYHKPDETWVILNYPDFETYNRHMVIKGNFHPSVPDDVVKAFTQAEYIMAHAYYHYPLYDEAFSKLLRIIEMAVKMRCKELNIALEKETRGKTARKKELQTLINEINEIEPEKNISEKLHNLRRIRNRFMHPDQYSYAPMIMPAAIKTGIIIINKLFMNTAMLQQNEEKRRELEEHLKSIPEDYRVIHYGEKLYPIIAIEIQNAVMIDGNWTYSVVWFPIMEDITKRISEHQQVPCIHCHLDTLVMGDKFITAHDQNRNIEIKIFPFKHEEIDSAYKTYKTAVENASESDRHLFEYLIGYEIGNLSTEFEYKYLAKSDTNNILK